MTGNALSGRRAVVAMAAALLALALALVAAHNASARATASAGPAAAKQDKFVIGVSNNLVGNGWREEMICSIKAQALASGKVSKVVVVNQAANAQQQQQHIRNLISQGVDAIIINPADRKALNPAIKQAIDRDIVVVAVDQAVSAPRRLRRDERPGRLRPPRRRVAVQEDGRQGERPLHARLRRRPGGHRP